MRRKSLIARAARSLQLRRWPNRDSLLHSEVITDFGQLLTLADEWRDLLERSPLTEPVLTPSWMLTWWGVFGHRKGRSLRVVIVRQGARLIGLVPLLRRVTWRSGVAPLVRLELLASGESQADEISSDFLGMIVEGGQESAVAVELAALLCGGKLGRWDELYLVKLNAADPMLPPLTRALADLGCRPETSPAGASPCLRLPGSWDDYLETLCGRRRYFLRRTMREFDKWAGSDGYQLQISDAAELAHGMKILCSLHAARWAGLRTGGAFASPLFSEFHNRVSQALDERDGTIEFVWLEVRGRPISALYTITYRGRVYFYQSGRAMDVPASVRPGIAIHILAIQRAMAAGHREYDLLGKEACYKKQLASTARPRVDLRVLAPTVRARLLDATYRLTRDLYQRRRRLNGAWGGSSDQ